MCTVLFYVCIITGLRTKATETRKPALGGPSYIAPTGISLPGCTCRTCRGRP
jgi:hypothetical protein